MMDDYEIGEFVVYKNNAKNSYHIAIICSHLDIGFRDIFICDLNCSVSIKDEQIFKIVFNRSVSRHNEKCQHEQAAIPEVLYKCIKCGEFYR